MSVPENDQPRRGAETEALEAEVSRWRLEAKDLRNRLSDSEARLRIAHQAALVSLVRAIEFKDPYRRGHYELVARYAVAVGRKMGLGEPVQERLRVGGMLMDIGKVAIDSSLLIKVEPLSDAEWETVRSHVEIGARILEPIVDPWEIADVVFEHHERWDGSGYPRGLAGEKILIEARILGICDSFVAMATARAFRKAFSRDLATAALVEEKGRHFDPEVTEAFLAVIRDENEGIVEDVARLFPRRDPQA